MSPTPASFSYASFSISQCSIFDAWAIVKNIDKQIFCFFSIN